MSRNRFNNEAAIRLGMFLKGNRGVKEPLSKAIFAVHWPTEIVKWQWNVNEVPAPPHPPSPPKRLVTLSKRVDRGLCWNSQKQSTLWIIRRKQAKVETNNDDIWFLIIDIYEIWNLMTYGICINLNYIIVYTQHDGCK